MPNSAPQTRNPLARLGLRYGLSAVLLLSLLCGCGQKGDLTLERPPPAGTPAQAEPDPVDEDA